MSSLRSGLGRRLVVASIFGLLAVALFGSGCAGGEKAEMRRVEQRSEAPPKVVKPVSPDAARPAQSTGQTSEGSALVWVGLESADQVALVDIARGRVIARYATPGGPHNVTVAKDGTAAAALYGSDRLALMHDGHVRFVRLGGHPHDVKAV